MSINEELSFTEYTLTEDTTDFIISFDRIGGSTDEVSILVNNTPIEDLVGYTVLQVNFSTWRVDPALPAGTVVRLARTTNLDEMVYVFTAGAKFVAKNVDSNFKQIQHSQQEIRDRQGKLESDATALLLEINDVKVIAEQAATDANEALEKVDDILSTGVVPAGMILTNSGQNQQQVNDFGGAKWYAKVGGYDLGAEVRLENGDRVRSTVAGNTNNPNVDMTGWQLEEQDLIDSSQSSFSALIVADLLEVKNPKPYQKKYVSSVGAWYTYYADTNQPENGVTVVDKWVMDTQPFYLASWFAKSDGTDQKTPISTGYAYATLKKRPFVIDGVFSLGSSTESRAGLEIISNSKLTFLPQGKFVQLPTTLGLYQLVNVFGAEDYTILNPNLEGDKLTHTGTTGEWGHLLNVMDSKNGFIFKPKLKYGWGDGLYIGRKSASELDYDPTNITVVEPEIEGCRRNGLSLCSGINVRIVRPKIKRIGDYDGKTGAFPKACIDVEPNQFAVGYSQPYIKDCIIEDAALSESYTGLYVSSHWDNVNFNIHIKGITRITSCTNNSFGFWNGGTGSEGSVVVDHIICDGSQSFIGSPFAWGSDGNLTCEIKQLDIAENWTTFSFHNTYNGNFTAKKLGNFVIRNIKWGKNTTCRFIYITTDQPYTFEYQFFKHPSVLKEFDIFHSGVTTVALAPTFGSDWHMDGTWDIVTQYSFSKLKPSTIMQTQPDATIRYVSMTGDYAKRTIKMNPLIADPLFGVYINGISVVMNGVTYTRLISKTRGASVTLQNVQGGNTKILDMIGEWQFAS